jgi:hypothetical protein
MSTSGTEGRPASPAAVRDAPDAGVAVYIAAWLLIPADGDDQPIAAAWIADCRDRFGCR